MKSATSLFGAPMNKSVMPSLCWRRGSRESTSTTLSQRKQCRHQLCPLLLEVEHPQDLRPLSLPQPSHPSSRCTHPLCNTTRLPPSLGHPPGRMGCIAHPAIISADGLPFAPLYCLCTYCGHGFPLTLQQCHSVVPNADWRDSHHLQLRCASSPNGLSRQGSP